MSSGVLFEAVVRSRQCYFAGSDHLTRSVQSGDLVFLHQKFQSLGKLSNNVFLPLHHLRDVDAYFLELQSVTFSLMLSETHMIRGNEKCLARDTSDVEAGAAKDFAFIDYRGVQTELSCSDCAGVSSRARGANDH